MLGYFGELHPRLLAALDLPGPMVVFELNLDAVADRWHVPVAELTTEPSVVVHAGSTDDIAESPDR